jgi:hypothetical protein
MDNPLYDVITVAHVAAAIAGFGTAALTGWYAAAVRRSPRGAEAERLLRYFRPGVNWGGRALLLVPLLGAALLALNHGQDVGQPYPWIGLALWTAAIGLASAVIWPGERRIQQELAADGLLTASMAAVTAPAAPPGRDTAAVPASGAPPGSGAPPASAAPPAVAAGAAPVAGAAPAAVAPVPAAGKLAVVCRRVERASAAMSVLFVLAVAVMIIQPS